MCGWVLLDHGDWRDASSRFVGTVLGLDWIEQGIGRQHPDGFSISFVFRLYCTLIAVSVHDYYG